MQRMRPAQRPATDGSRTIVIHDAAPRELHPADPETGNTPEDSEDKNEDDHDRDRTVQPVLVLNLKGGGNDPKRKRKAGQRVVWKEDVIDNEGAGKKKSKLCCIYHKPRRWDESSDESSDSDCEDHNHAHNHGHGEPAGGSASSSSNNVATSSTTVVVPSVVHHSDPNAYESQPRHRPAPHE